MTGDEDTECQIGSCEGEVERMAESGKSSEAI